MTKAELAEKLKKEECDHLIYQTQTKEGTGTYAIEFDYSNPFFGSNQETTIAVTELNGVYSIVRDTTTIYEGNHDLIDKIPKSGGKFFIYCSDNLEVHNAKFGDSSESLEKDRQLAEKQKTIDGLIGNQKTKEIKDVIRYALIGCALLGVAAIAYKVMK